MKADFGKWHGLHAYYEDPTDTESALLIDVMHDSGCEWSIDYHPAVVDQYGERKCEPWYVRRYACDLQNELDNYGLELGPTEPGFYWCRIEHIVYLGGPWFATEYATGFELLPARRPSVQIEPGEEACALVDDIP